MYFLYFGLRVRVTEKVKKGKELTILKHTSGTVVLWELHSGDRQPSSAQERLLSSLPNVIFIHIDDATWQLDGLPPGVYPLTAVARTWTLNKDIGANITRKGFTIVPDFASTAFMIQGATLEAMIADCGDAFDNCKLSDMVNAYAILSRV